MRIVSQIRPRAARPCAVDFLACNASTVTRASGARGLGIGATLVAGLLISRPLSAAPSSGGDENGPKIQILAPRYQDVLKGRTRILIAITATQFNPESVELFVDDVSVSGTETEKGPIKLSNFASSSFDWDTRQFSEGPHKLKVQVTDKNGFRSWASVTVFLNNKNVADNTPPSLDWNNLENYQELSGQTQIELKALDNFGVKYIIASISPVGDPNKKTLSWFRNQPPYVLKFDTTKVADGLYKVNAKAYDAKDQEGEAKTLTVGVVNNAVNASSTSDYLAAMKRAEKVKAELESGKNGASKAPTNFVPDVPLANPDNKSGNAVEKPVKNQNTTKNGKTLPGNNKSNKALPPIGGADEPDLIVKVPRTTENSAKVALPAFSNSKGAQTDSTIASAAVPTRDLAEIEETKTPRLARLQGPQREVETRANFSGADSASGQIAPALKIAAPSVPTEAEIENEATPRAEFARLAAPASAQRFVAVGTASWSRSIRVESLALSGVRRFENVALEGEDGFSARLARPNALARTSTPIEVKTPRFSPIGALSRALLARRTRSDKIEVAEKTARVAKIAAPATQKGASVAPAPAQTVKPVLSSQKAAKSGVKTEKVTGAGLSKTLVKPKIAALPRAEKSRARNQRAAAITVAPIQASVQNPIPTRHRVERTTTLHAIAARYGMPVELVAAANHWPAEMRVLRGMTVKLPQPLQVSYNGATVNGDVPSMMAGDIGVTAFRALFEQAGGTLKWNGAKQQVTARKGESEIVVTIGSSVARVDNQKVMMNLAAFLFEGRTMIPVRFFEEGLKAEVDWDPQTGRLVIAMAG